MIGQYSTPTHSTQFEEIVNNRTPGPPKHSQRSFSIESPTDETPSSLDNRLADLRLKSTGSTEPSIETTVPSVQTTEPSVRTTEPPVQTTEPSTQAIQPSVQESEPPITEPPVQTAGQENQTVNNHGKSASIRKFQTAPSCSKICIIFTYVYLMLVHFYN